MLPPWKKGSDEPRRFIKEQKHHFANKGLYHQRYAFSSSHIQMWVLNHEEDWVPKNWYVQLWCWITLLRVPWTARRSNQSILKEINLEYSLEGLMQKLQYFGHLIQWADSLEKTLILRKIEGRGRSRWQRVRWLNGIIDSMDMSLSKHGEMVKDREAWHAAVSRVRHDLVTEQ